MLVNVSTVMITGARYASYDTEWKETLDQFVNKMFEHLWTYLNRELDFGLEIRILVYSHSRTSPHFASLDISFHKLDPEKWISLTASAASIRDFGHCRWGGKRSSDLIEISSGTSTEPTNHSISANWRKRATNSRVLGWCSLSSNWKSPEFYSETLGHSSSILFLITDHWIQTKDITVLN